MRHSWIRPERRALLRTVRALSTMRVARHGALPVDETIWWRQISELAVEHGLALPTPEQWRTADDPDTWELPL